MNIQRKASSLHVRKRKSDFLCGLTTDLKLSVYGLFCWNCCYICLHVVTLQSRGIETGFKVNNMRRKWIITSVEHGLKIIKMLYLSVQLLFSMSNVLEYNSFYFCYSSKYLFAWEQNFNHYLTSLVEMWLNCLYPDTHYKSYFATKHNVSLGIYLSLVSPCL